MMVAQNNLHGLGAAQANPVIFTDPKLNAMREAAIASDWDALFKIAPRGCLRAGDRGLTRSDDTYGHCAEPEAYGGQDVADLPAGLRDRLYWQSKNPLRRQLTINDLRFKKDANGRVVKVPYTRAELIKYYNTYTLSRRRWLCADSQIDRYVNTAFSGSHPIYPIGLCDQTSKARRRKIIKKIAVAAAAVTGAVMFGPALISKAGAALGSGAGATGAAVKGATGIVGTVVGGAGKLAAKVLPQAAQILNGAATIKALANGTMPPPPISIGDGNFTDYAKLVGDQLLQRELGKQTDAAQKAELAAYIEFERRRLAANEPRHYPVVNSGLNPALTAAQKDRADAATAGGNLYKYAAIGLGTFLLARAIQ